MLTELQELKSLCRVTCSSKETPLIILVDRIKSDPGRYSLKRSTLYQSHWLIWDNKAKDYVITTHAFAVRQASHPSTGNFVPPKQKAPEGLMEAQIKSEPGPYAQISITMDARLEEGLHSLLSDLEQWAKSEPGFVTTGRSRNSWMSPVSIANNGRYVMSSPLFMGKNTFNSKEDGILVGYKVHPWVAAAVKDDPNWVPNPNLVRILHLEDDRTLTEVTDSERPCLEMGDIVKTTFKLVFTSYSQQWNMAGVPIQVIRLGQLDKSAYSSIVNLEDHGRLDLPRAGERLGEFFYVAASTTTNAAPLPTKNSNDAASDDGSVEWREITPLSEEVLNEGATEDKTDKERITEGGGKAEVFETDEIAATSMPAVHAGDTSEGKPMQSGETEQPAIGSKAAPSRGRKRAAAGTSKTTRTVKARTGL
ncbi:hypothetical protein DFP72DRAFT_849879 [Ephemerocybe angulata]|uniref:Uncharacterized protein n=1 Tax=Ephemerocybe angulata TaxID=980116 RepID=A0A8H6M2T4_9AGAR|nr:hypothetical protein DFP72DRAFT_849879 [Tulosesus angulatus]